METINVCSAFSRKIRLYDRIAPKGDGNFFTSANAFMQFALRSHRPERGWKRHHIAGEINEGILPYDRIAPKGDENSATAF